MWIIAKIKKNNFNIFKYSIKKKLPTIKFYTPKILIQKLRKKTIKHSDFFILEDYIFCFNKEFENINKKIELNYIKGLKYFLIDSKNYQKQIIDFINCCRSKENCKGYLKPEFFEKSIDEKKKFITGIFTDLIFEIVKKTDKKLKIVINGLKVTIEDKDRYFYKTA